ncbi:MAG: VWA domain-containing protein [Lutisporaceae bacterium]
MNRENENAGEIRQIILITDGKSNIGISPIEAARQANKAGIVVSTIGIINQDSDDEERDIEELEGIAKAGGGLCEYTHLENLGMTVQVMTQKTAQRTIEQIVSRQLKSIVGVDINNLEPKSRFKIVDFIENFGDSINLRCAVVLDTSGSMKNKLETAKKSMTELLRNLKSRRGHSKIAVIKYPGLNNEYASIICSFTDSEKFLKDRLDLLKAGGGTPTGLAIERACQLIIESKDNESDNSSVYVETQEGEVIDKYYV